MVMSQMGKADLGNRKFGLTEKQITNLRVYYGYGLLFYMVNIQR